MAIGSELHERIKRVATDLRQELWGEGGCPEWGTKFTQIEDECCEVGDLLARELMGQGLDEQGLDEQAEVKEGPQQCGVCGRNAVEDELEPKIITTRRGDIAWQQRKYYCKRCRKALFPSGRRVGA